MLDFARRQRRQALLDQRVELEARLAKIRAKEAVQRRNYVEGRREPKKLVSPDCNVIQIDLTLCRNLKIRIVLQTVKTNAVSSLKIMTATTTTRRWWQSANLIPSKDSPQILSHY